MAEQDLFCVGKIIGTHGLRGNLKTVFNVMHFEEVLPFVCDVDGACLKVRYNRILKNNVHLIAIEGLNHINEVTGFINAKLFVDLCNIDEKNGAFLEIQGRYLNVVNENDEFLGTMNGLANFGGGELIRIGKDGNEDFLPAHCIKKVDRVAKKIIVEELEFA